MAAVTNGGDFYTALQALPSLSGYSIGTFLVGPPFGGKSLFLRPSVHYRDETDISGLVAPGGQPITDNSPMARRHPVGGFDREQVTLCMTSGIAFPPPSVTSGG
jgi:hypothetical protein